MRAYRLGKVATAAAFLATVTVSNVLAQPTGNAPSGELGVQKRATLTNEEQLLQADAIARRASQLAERLSRMLDEARKDRDIMRANCVNRKLTEVNANGRNVEQRRKALKDAVDAHDEARSSHEFTVLSVLGQKLDSLGVEANQCLGQSVYEPGAAQVVTTVPNNVFVGVDPSSVPVTPPPPPAVSVPPPVSAAE